VEISQDNVIKGLRVGHLTLVDVLSPESFALRHIPGAINVPVVDLARRAADLLPHRDAAIVLYCGGPT
jgi:rhodanese-related sulfurtransferase